ncbi:hypothetical protein SUGI_1032110 [Cryptomeria japonica]|nr:hypothetical protein SUGI_1032110 [Cryptomeria japonica]
MAASLINDLEARLDETELMNKVTLKKLVKIELILFLSFLIAFCIVVKFAVNDYYKHPEKSIAFNILMLGILVGLLAFFEFFMYLVSEASFQTKNLILFSKVHLCIVTVIFLFSFLGAIDLMIRPQQIYVANCASAGAVAIECLILYGIVSLS